MNPIALILLFPLLGFALNGTIGHKLPKGIAPWIGTLFIFLPFVITLGQWNILSNYVEAVIKWDAYTFF